MRKDFDSLRQLLLSSESGEHIFLKAEQVGRNVSVGELRICDRQLRAMIDSMTEVELKQPRLVLESSRLRRIARGSGVARQIIREVVHFLLDWQERRYVGPATRKQWSELCEQFHHSVIAGVCPWCGAKVCC